MFREFLTRLTQPQPAPLDDGDARLALMDTQQIEGTFLFPTLGVGMEESLKHDPEALVAAFRAFNRWMQEDWGFAHKERLFAAPYITLVDADAAVAELEWALAHDARVIVMDEPSATLTGPETERLLQVVGELKASGIG